MRSRADMASPTSVILEGSTVTATSTDDTTLMDEGAAESEEDSGIQSKDDLPHSNKTSPSKTRPPTSNGNGAHAEEEEEAELVSEVVIGEDQDRRKKKHPKEEHKRKVFHACTRISLF